MNYLIRLSFVGTAYCGWQMQKNGPSVQEQVMNAVKQTFGSVERFAGCSRTDSGVHATDYCVSFTVPGNIPCDKLPDALNARLPRDITVFSAVNVSDDFHARYSVKRKTYCYFIDPHRHPTSFWANRVWHRPGEYDLPALSAAAEGFVGKYDFTSFMAAGSKITDAKRTVFSASVDSTPEGWICFSVTADGFLYNMVRIMVGTLLSDGMTAERIGQIIAARDRKAAGMTAPAEGLYLTKVEY